MESCRLVFLATLYSVMTRPAVRCGKWPWPVSAGQGCAYRIPDLGSCRQVDRIPQRKGQAMVKSTRP